MIIHTLHWSVACSWMGGWILPDGWFIRFIPVFILIFSQFAFGVCPQDGPEDRAIARARELSHSLGSEIYLDYLEIIGGGGFFRQGASSDELRDYFASQAQHLENHDGLLPEAPERMRYPINDYAAFETYKKKLWLRRLAFQLFQDFHEELPWNLSSYGQSDLEALMSYEKGFQDDFSWSYLDFIEYPDRIYRQKKFLGKTQRETLLNMSNWMASDVQHRTYIGGERPHRERYEVHIPEHYDDYSNGGGVGACGINGAFMCATAHSNNIPCRTNHYSAEGTNMHMHTRIDFPAQQMYMSHGDNPYSRGLNKVWFEGDERALFLNTLSIDPQAAETMWQPRN